MNKTDSDSQADARRILERLAREAAPGDPNRHRHRRFAPEGAAAEDDDRIDRWGTRIGRLLAAVFSIGVVGWALLVLARG